MAGRCVTAGSAASEVRAAARSRRCARARWWVSQACSRSRMNLAMLVVTDTGLPRSRTVLVSALPHFDAPAMRSKRNRQRTPGAGTMNHMSAVRSFQAGDVPAATAIVRGLSDYFTEDVPDQVEHDAARHQAWVIPDSGTVAGFAAAARKSPAGAEILWIAVDAARRGRGHGTRLLGRGLDHLGADGISGVGATTLDRSSAYRPYEATRAFWERTGFVQVDTIDPLPGWEPGNPAAIYGAALRPHRDVTR